MAPKVAVVGHVEWVEFARVESVPAPGEIVHAEETWEVPAGGGAVAAVQLAKLAGACTLYTALGDDELGHRAERELRGVGLRVEAAFRDGPQRRAFTYTDSRGERTITTIGDRLAPRGDDPLPWGDLSGTDAVYLTAGDVGAVRAARAAGALVATARVLPLLKEASVELDALIGSARDPAEPLSGGSLDPPPRAVVATEGAAGGAYRTADGRSGRWAAAPVPGPVADTYGCGDSFAAGLAFGLGSGFPIDRALELAAQCGAACLTGRGPYAGQLRLTGHSED